MRVKRGVSHLKRRKRLLKKVKGFRGGRKNKPKLAKVAVLKAGVNAFRDRRRKKREFRGLWNIKINAGTRQHGLSYSKFIDLLKKNKIELDRKVLSDLAENEPKTFENIVKEVASKK